MSLRGKQANGLVTQQRVLRAAVAQFLEKGCTGTTTADITGAAGIAQSSFFHVFPSKEALLLELVRRMFGGQFDLAGQHSGAADPMFLYAVETALSLSLAEAFKLQKTVCCFCQNTLNSPRASGSSPPYRLK